MNMEKTQTTEQKPAEQKPEEQKAEPKKFLAVGVQFRRTSKIYTFLAADSALAKGDRVMVEAEGGLALATVAKPPREVSESDLPQNAKRITRRATAKDIEEEAKSKERALEYFDICSEKVRERNLTMKLVDAQIEEGGRKAVFIFYAEQRVDFRALVKDMAQQLHMRIEMRQIGSRDESKYKGCLGPCGLPTCCSQHLRQFESISISMAKNQGLAPNPPKLTGMCGKLKCCLSYENDVYSEYRKSLLKAGSAVNSPRGAGKIIGYNVLKRECVVKLFGGGEFRCPCDSCQILTPQEKEEAIAAAKQAEEAGDERARRIAEKRGSFEARTARNDERKKRREERSGKNRS